VHPALQLLLPACCIGLSNGALPRSHSPAWDDRPSREIVPSRRALAWAYAGLPVSPPGHIPRQLGCGGFCTGNGALGQMGAFVFAMLGYVILAWHLPANVFAHAACWSAVGAVFFCLRAIGLYPEWYATAATVLSLPYLIAGRWLTARKERKHFLPGYPVAGGALLVAGFSLVGLATLGGITVLFFNYWAGVAALALAAVILAGCAWLFHQPLFVPLSAGLWICTVFPGCWSLVIGCSGCPVGNLVDGLLGGAGACLSRDCPPPAKGRKECLLDVYLDQHPGACNPFGSARHFWFFEALDEWANPGSSGWGYPVLCYLGLDTGSWL